MNTIKLKAPGKINWTLNVTGRRPDGYHEVEMLMQSISLWDELILTECREGIEVAGNARIMPLDESNLAAKAARLIMDRFGVKGGVRIEINKNIPVSAGLAGGSADAAAVLAGLNALWQLGLSDEELAGLGAALGADIPFCIFGGTALARGIGDRLTSLPALEDIPLVLVKPSIGVSTASVYQALKLDEINFRPDWEMVYQLLAAGEFYLLSSYMGNVLEQVTAKLYPQINEIKEALDNAGAAVSMMTGSGSAVFGVFESARQARKRKAKAAIPMCFYTLHTAEWKLCKEEAYGQNKCCCAGRRQPQRVGREGVENKSCCPSTASPWLNVIDALRDSSLITRISISGPRIC